MANHRTLAFLTFITATTCAGVAHAQGRGYAEAVAQSAFGNVTSQSYGGEVGFTVWKNVQVFVEFGQTRNVAPAEMGVSAQLIAGFLTQTVGATTFSVKEPASFGAAGVRYLIPIPGSKVQPYVMGGYGVAKVSKDVAFLINGTDVTSQLGDPKYGVVLGTDLKGDFTKPMFVVGAGVVWPIWGPLILDFQGRFGRISAEDSDPIVPAAAINVGRVGLGIGVRF